MEIKNLHLNDLRNNENFQFHTKTKLSDCIYYQNMNTIIINKY